MVPVYLLCRCSSCEAAVYRRSDILSFSDDRQRQVVVASEGSRLRLAERFAVLTGVFFFFFLDPSCVCDGGRLIGLKPYDRERDLSASAKTTTIRTLTSRSRLHSSRCVSSVLLLSYALQPLEIENFRNGFHPPATF